MPSGAVRCSCRVKSGGVRCRQVVGAEPKQPRSGARSSYPRNAVRCRQGSQVSDGRREVGTGNWSVRWFRELVPGLGTGGDREPSQTVDDRLKRSVPDADNGLLDEAEARCSSRAAREKLRRAGMYAVVLLVVVGTAIWVGADASGRDWSGDGFANKPWKWVVGCLLLWIVVFPLYLARRNRVAQTS